MKKLAFSFIFLLFILVACTDKNVEDAAEKEVPIDTSSEDLTSDADKPEQTYNWEGEYVYLHDTINGLLTISEQDQKEFTYQLVLKQTNENNEVVAEEDLKGSGAITNKDALLEIANKDCQLTLTHEGKSLLAKSEGTDCNETLGLTGTYINPENGEAPPLFKVDEGRIYINGLTFGNTPTDAKAIWGNPDPVDSNEDDILMEHETVHHYASDNMFITYHNYELYALTAKANADDLANVKKSFTGEHYKDTNSDSEFFLVPEDGQLLIYRSSYFLNPGGHEFLLIAVDENFFYAVDSGAYTKVN
ncbi:hypothetical protein [Sporosarcina sp. ITBMC105]